MSNDGVFIVDHLLDKKVQTSKKGKCRKRVLYLTRWEGYSKEYDTWEPAEGLPSICISEYEARETEKKLDCLLSAGGPPESVQPPKPSAPSSATCKAKKYNAKTTKKRSRTKNSDAEIDTQKENDDAMCNSAVEIRYDGKWWIGRIVKLICQRKEVHAMDLVFTDGSKLRLSSGEFRQFVRLKTCTGEAVAGGSTCCKVAVASLEPSSPDLCVRGATVCVKFEGPLWYDGIVTAVGAGGMGEKEDRDNLGSGTGVDARKDSRPTATCSIRYSDEACESGVRVPDPDIFVVRREQNVVPVDLAAVLKHGVLVELRQQAVLLRKEPGADQPTPRDSMLSQNRGPLDQKALGEESKKRKKRRTQEMKDSTNRREEPKNAMPRKSEEEKVNAADPKLPVAPRVRSVWDDFLGHACADIGCLQGQPDNYRPGLGSWQLGGRHGDHRGCATSNTDFWCGWPVPSEIKEKREQRLREDLLYFYLGAY